MLRNPFFAIFRNRGTTDPLEPITFPYLTTVNDIFLEPLILFDAIKSLSAHSLEAPYKFDGEAALSVLRAITLETPA